MKYLTPKFNQIMKLLSILNMIQYFKKLICDYLNF